MKEFVSRREFIRGAFMYGAFALTLSHLSASDVFSIDDQVRTAVKLEDGSILIKNPAFSKRLSNGSIFLQTTKPNGKQLVFEIDSDAEFLWDQIGDVWEYDQSRKTSLGSLMVNLLKRFPERNPEKLKQEAKAFLTKAIGAGIVCMENNARAIFNDTTKSQK